MHSQVVHKLLSAFMQGSRKCSNVQDIPLRQNGRWRCRQNDGRRQEHALLNEGKN